MRNNRRQIQKQPGLFVIVLVLSIFPPLSGWSEQAIVIRLDPGGRSYSLEFSETQLLFQTLAGGESSVLEVSLTTETGAFLGFREDRFYQGTLTLGYDLFLQVWTLEISDQYPVTRESSSPRVEYFDQPILVLERLRNIELPPSVPNLQGRLRNDAQIILEARFYGRRLDPALWVLRPFLWGRVGVSRQVMREVP